MVKPAAGYLPLAYSSPEPVQTPGTIAVLDMLVQRRRDSWAASRLMRKLLKKQGFAPKLLVTESCARTARRSAS
jgi:hypothetical protein